MGTPSIFSRVADGEPIDPLPAEPVLAAEVKSFMRVTSAADDTLIGFLIIRARMIAERLTGRTIVKKNLLAYWDFIPGVTRKWWDGVRDGHIGMDQSDALELPRPPLISVAEVRVYNDDNTSAVMVASDYFVDVTDPDLPGRVCLKLGATWPVFTRTRNGFRVSYQAGYDTVPQDMKHAILLMASWLYKNRGDCSDDGCAGSCGAMGFLRNYVMMRGS